MLVEPSGARSVGGGGGCESLGGSPNIVLQKVGQSETLATREHHLWYTAIDTYLVGVGTARPMSCTDSNPLSNAWVTVFFGFEACVPGRWIARAHRGQNTRDRSPSTSPEAERLMERVERARSRDVGVFFATAVTGTGLKLGLGKEGRDGLTAVPRRGG
ncbi:hypothetical protein FB451DRAFT_1176408 [Mycena latifolia]|nr:hypothetical protein FB451DRAFT_1176408 [Mycena latifolia]